MQFRLTLIAQDPSAQIPFNYPYLLTGWLYRLLANADGQYARFLHEQGYQTDSLTTTARRKTFRLFTFSDLRLHGYEVRPREGCFVLTSPVVDWTISFYVDRAAEAFITGLFQNQHVTLTNRRFRTDMTVERVETLPLPPLSNTLTLRTLSPVVVAEKSERRAGQAGMDQYLHPADDQFGPLLLVNLVDKYRSANPNASDASALDTKNFTYNLITKPGLVRSRLVTIKEGSREETKVRGWYGFEFELSGPAEVLEVGLLAGVGRYNAEGFGCVGAVRAGTTSVASGFAVSP